MPDTQTDTPKPMLHTVDSNRIVSTISKPLVLAIVAGTLILGGLTGLGASRLGSMSNAGTSADGTTDTTDSSGAKTSAGILDKETFKDSTEGTLKEGGFEGEGNFHLIRPELGGADKNVYLTSTTVDLSEFVGKKVRVWGQTFAAEKAGWLMDVGYIEVIK